MMRMMCLHFMQIIYLFSSFSKEKFSGESLSLIIREWWPTKNNQPDLFVRFFISSQSNNWNMQIIYTYRNIICCDLKKPIIQWKIAANGFWVRSSSFFSLHIMPMTTWTRHRVIFWQFFLSTRNKSFGIMWKSE